MQVNFTILYIILVSTLSLKSLVSNLTEDVLRLLKIKTPLQNNCLLVSEHLVETVGPSSQDTVAIPRTMGEIRGHKSELRECVGADLAAVHLICPLVSPRPRPLDSSVSDLVLDPVLSNSYYRTLL